MEELPYKWTGICIVSLYSKTADFFLFVVQDCKPIFSTKQVLLRGVR